jgi:serine/threonine protein kinase
MTAVDPEGSATVGRYRLVQQLGEGGMGVVHLGLDPAGHAVAVKILRAHIAADPHARRRMEREVRTLRRLRHHRIAEVLDAELTGDTPYLVTRFVPGKTVDQLVQDNGPLSAEAALSLGRGLAEALEAIHAAGIVHRDLKPANVMMVDADPVVIDFGIAHLVDESRITVTGLVMGTPGYLSPEVVEGMAITRATDWWGWAATLAYATTGRPPFGSGPTEVVLDRVRRGRADLEGVPEPLGSVLASVLTVGESDRRPGEWIRQWLGLDPEMTRSPEDAGDAQPDPAGEPPATPGTPVQGRTVVFTPVPDAGQERTVRHPMPAEPSATVFDGAPLAKTQKLPVAPVPQPQAWPTAQPLRRADVDRPVIVPPKPNPAPPNVPVPPASGWAPAGMVPGQPPQQPVGQPPQQPVDQPPGPVKPTGTLLLLALAGAGVTAVAPGGAIVALFLIMTLARTIDRSATSIWRRRTMAGPRAGDIPVAVVSLPWQLTLALASSLLSMILPVLIAISVAFIVGAASAPDVSPQPASPLPLAVAGFAGVITAWWGPGGGAFRRGTRSAARWAISGTAGRIILWSLLVLVVISALLVAAQGEPVDWSPFPSPRGVIPAEP